MAQRSALLAIINPQSGTRSVTEKLQVQRTLVQQAETLDYAIDIAMTTRPGHATELARQAVEQGFTRVLVIGGDGTINETAQGLRRSATALGVVPIGSGNGLARHLGLPLDPHKAIERALRGRPVVIDSGEINGHPFFCTAGMGFEAQVAHAFAQATERGLPTYIRTAFREFWTYKSGRYWIDGEEKELFSLTFANAGQFGNNAWMAPTANIADGRLDLCEISPFPAAMATMLTLRLFTKTLDKSPYWQSKRITRVSVETNEPVPIHVDGEPLLLPANQFDVRVLPASLLVLL